ncbi:hypothetical protein A5747_13265 [Mycobacterium sp. IS-836]|uniref:hypothetical protein n=1 Tax=Mycobacterium sp. IS-836 TaxID=1834160 RepID=UPI00096DF181|nr:hypothetical protein [Mycobacterium sp. IS-836]OMC55359.1 hypothetical protein A5747_13265 [Mycobacterium sp. IS-836]
MKLGKLTATPEAAALRLCDYVANVPPPPAEFGHHNTVPFWGMLANDKYGDCVFAGAAHEHLLWTAEAGQPVTFSDANVIAAYASCTHFNPFLPDPNPTDRGTNVIKALDFRKKYGIADAKGTLHKIEAYARINPNPDAIAQAAWLFSAVGVGIQMPMSAMNQFKAGQPWDVPRGWSPNVGGHYVPIIGRINGYLVCVTWGRLQLITPKFLAKFCDEAYAIFSPEFLKDGKSPEGFDKPALITDLNGMAA